MRIFYLLILIAAALAYPISYLGAMEHPPTNASNIDADGGLAPAQIALDKLLSQYKEIAAKGGWPALKPSQKKLEPGAVDSRIAIIRDIVFKTGDLANAESENPTLYDEALVEAVKRFQQRHGLTDDGVIGRETFIALSTPVEKRIRQIEHTIKRMGEFKPDASGRYLVVNLPEFYVRGFVDNKQVLEMKAIIGTPKNPTPIFDKQMTYVSFNPHWGVPIRIAAEEMLPKILENPEFFNEENLEVFELTDDGRKLVDPAQVNWAEHNKDNFPYLLRQRPGRENALGKIKFGLQNSNDIYMHDTSSPRLFAKEIRALSHGCMRLEKPYEMAKFVFATKENFTQEKMDALYNGDESRIITIPSLTVHTVYWTAWVDANGKANFRRDIYNLD